MRRSRAATGGDRRNYRALALAFALGCLLPIVVQGLALFVASFHSQLVLVTSIFLIGTGL